VNVFTEGLPEVSFSASLDSKGRITVPARIRNRLGIDKGDEIVINLKSKNVVKRQFETKDEALEFLSELGEVESFSFDGDTLEAILDE
jgi:AbrB family looped-hinge helix DNA binding protein